MRVIPSIPSVPSINLLGTLGAILPDWTQTVSWGAVFVGEGEGAYDGVSFYQDPANAMPNFSRSGSALYFADNLITSFAADVPRIGSRGLLVDRDWETV